MKYKLLTTALITMALASGAGCGSTETDDSVTETATEVTTETETESTTEETTAETTTAVTTTEAVTQAETQAEAQTAAPQQASANETAAAQSTVPAPAPGSLGVTYRNTKIMLNSNMSEISSALGSTTDYSEAPSCNYDGLDKVFVYGNVSIYTYPHGSGDFINEIEVNDEQVATDKGIAPIGKTIDEVKAVYGEPTSTEGSTYKYANGNCYTYFYADNGVVSYWGVVYEA